MNKFVLYILKLFIKNLLIISILILLIQYLSSGYGNLGSLEGYKYSMIDFIILTSYGIVLGINQLMPIITAVSIMITIIILMKNNELLAYMSIGGSIFKLAAPLIFVGIILVCFMLYSEYKIIPKTRIDRENMLDKMKNRPKSIGNTYYNIWFVNKDNIITNIGLVSSSEKTVYDIQEYVLDNNGQLKYVNKIEKIVKENNIWNAYNIQIIDVSQNPPKIIFKQKEVTNDITWEKLTNISSGDIRSYNPKELYTLIQLYNEKGINTNKLKITLYFKFASAISVIILIIVLYPMSINFSRNYSIVRNASITLMVCVIFIVIQQSFLSLGNNGIFHPIVAVFMPLLIFLCISLAIIYYKNKPS